MNIQKQIDSLSSTITFDLGNIFKRPNLYLIHLDIPSFIPKSTVN